MTGARGLSHSLSRLRSETIATQILPSRPVEMLSGYPGRLMANGVIEPARSPGSQYLEIRQVLGWANTNAGSSAVSVTRLANYRFEASTLAVPSGSRRNT